MFGNLFKRTRSHEVPQELYGSVVTQARQPVFFIDFGFEDSVMARFDLVALHLYLFSRRLVREDTPTAQSLNQEVFDTFTDDTDRALRELGIGDTSVPKRKKKMIRTFYAMVEDFGGPLDTGNFEDLVTQLKERFVPKENSGKENSDTGDFQYEALAKYIQTTAKCLDENASASIFKGQINWPAPEKFV